MNTPNNIVYGLVDPKTGDVRYVGSTRRGIRRAVRPYKMGNFDVMPLEYFNHPSGLENAVESWKKRLEAAGEPIASDEEQPLFTDSRSVRVIDWASRKLGEQ